MTTVNTVAHGTMKCPITANKILENICATVSCMGKDTLGFTAKEVRTHSTQSASTMEIYLAQVPVFAIMLIGMWSSDAFLLCIREQVQDFTKGISSKMLISPNFLTIPDAAAHHRSV
eukprot:12312077-Ditylum_brightwellii.AAC.1